MHFGLLNLCKPTGMTSRRVVDRVERLVRPAKAGHAGTLDPLASGVLVVCVGQATRLIEYVQRMTKRYTGTFLLGRTSATLDMEGEVELIADAPRPLAYDLAEAVEQFVGLIEQRPPAFSALKVAGRRAYDLARAGSEVLLAPRQVRIDRLDVVRYDYPELVLDVECGSGTYIRSLGSDIARRLGTGAVMSGLVRTAIGEFRLEEACLADDLTAENLPRHLHPPLCALAGMPRIVLSDEERDRVSRGLTIAARPLAAGAAETAALDENQDLAAIVAPRPDGTWGPVRNFRSGGDG